MLQMRDCKNSSHTQNSIWLLQQHQSSIHVDLYPMRYLTLTSTVLSRLNRSKMPQIPKCGYALAVSRCVDLASVTFNNNIDNQTTATQASHRLVGIGAISNHVSTWGSQHSTESKVEGAVKSELEVRPPITYSIPLIEATEAPARAQVMGVTSDQLSCKQIKGNHVFMSISPVSYIPTS